MGQSLTLQCEMTITNDLVIRSVNIMWSSNGTQLRRIDNLLPSTVGNSLVYTDSYTISQLSTIDDGRVIQCEANITEATSMFYHNNITLYVTGKYYHIKGIFKAYKFHEKLNSGFYLNSFARQLQTFDYWYSTNITIN